MPLEIPDPQDSLEYVQAYAERGYTRCIPLPRGKKFPPLVKWKPYQTRDPSPAEYQEWFANEARNLGIIVPEDMVVIDCDTPEMLELVFRHCGETPMWSRTPRGGGHAFYRRRQGVELTNQVGLKDGNADFRVLGSYVVEQPSVDQNDVPYVWQGEVLPVDELPILKVSWLRDYAKNARKKADQIGLAIQDSLDARIRRAMSYVAQIEGAVSGQRGHDRTMRVAGILVQKFRLEIEDALPIFKMWNETCEPPWEEKELLHKLQDAFRNRHRYNTDVS